jgi:hypothetical protein
MSTKDNYKPSKKEAEEFAKKHLKIRQLMERHSALRNLLRKTMREDHGGYSRIIADETDKIEREFIQLTHQTIWEYGKLTDKN